MYKRNFRVHLVGPLSGDIPKMLMGPAGYELVDRCGCARLGAGETELLEEGDLDLGGGYCVRVAVEFLVGGLDEDHEEFARRRMPCGAEIWKELRYIFAACGQLAVKGTAWSNRVVTEKESAEHWTHAAIGTYCPHLEVFGVWGVRRTSSLFIVLAVSVPRIVINFIFSVILKSIVPTYVDAK